MEKLFKPFVFLLSLIFIFQISVLSVSANSSKQETHYGIALKDKTNVYSEQSTSSKVLKFYDKGTILKYQSGTSEWYEAKVYINGKPHTGYIHVNDVETSINNPVTLKGIGLKNPTHVFQNASTNSKILKSYSNGSILKFQTFSKEWYKATVYVNGKRNKGYIHVSHVETSIENQQNLEGIGLKSKTNVYQIASTGSKIIKSYDVGTVLKYRTFSNNWYEATVYVKGKRTTGYINKNDVENAVETKQTINGIALKGMTPVYSSASTNSKILKNYYHGTKLIYKTFTSNWYEAKIYINGKPTTGYIHKSHVEGTSENLGEGHEGRAIKRPTNVYIFPSRDSNILKSYSHGSLLKFEDLSVNWYVATVYINGKPQKGYIHKTDITLDDVTIIKNYSVSFSNFVDIQMTRSPKADGAGKILANRELVEYYANPSNFIEGSKEYFQFLDLSQSAGLNAKEINEKILYNKGILQGRGQAFVDASKKHGVNEAYLIAHALHETGNGTSDLAKGIPVDKNGNITRDSEGNIAKTNDTYKTVYNVFGIGAYDDTPLVSGVKTAFENKWFSPEEAIIGGAGFIGNDYIKKGQNTLYKMRWNPDNPGVHQYATHVAWATAQTSRIYELYQMIDNYILIYEVPKFVNQPKATTKPTSPQTVAYPNGIYGQVTGVEKDLNFRSGPSTSYGILGAIPNNTKIQVLGQHVNGWYQIIYNNKQGYVSNEYVTLLNLIEVTIPVLNVRTEPVVKDSTKFGSVGYEYVAGVLDSNNNLVRSNEWYQIHYSNGKYWISGGLDGTEYVNIIK